MSVINKKDIAIIGMACRFPQARNYSDYWENLLARKNCISEIPEQRWCWQSFEGDPQTEVNKSNSRWGGFIEGAEYFDYRFFGISPNTAEVMDPQQRIMLELSWACMEDAGVVPKALAGSRVGVFIGVFNFDYKELLERHERPIEAYQSTGTASAIIANRISHFYDFCGPSLTLDTACSASMNAVHSAVQSLQLGETELAMAGGVNLILTPTRHISFAKTGMLSPTGASRSFDDAADGYVRSEGAAILLLKPLEMAITDRDPVHGVIKGSAVNHCGKTHTLTYPDSEAQAKVISDAISNAQISPETVTYLEAHGTGTPKGDPIEIKGLTTAYQDFKGVKKTGYCAIGSAKSNIGHLEAAAGIAGIIKVLLSMKKNTLPALANFNSLNSRIQLSDTPFYVLDRTRNWEQLTDGDGQKIPRRAGVSSFGFGGTNSHVILEEASKLPYSAEEIAREQQRGQAAYSNRHLLFVFSAKTFNSLSTLLADMRHWLLQNQSEPLENISSTLFEHRTQFQHRIAIIADSPLSLVNSLQVALDKFSQGENIDKPVYDTVDLSFDDNLSWLITCASKWLKDEEFDHDKAIPRRKAVSRLPTYPFERTECWIDFAKEAHDFAVSVKQGNCKEIHATHSLKPPEKSLFDSSLQPVTQALVQTHVEENVQAELELTLGVGKCELVEIWEPVAESAIYSESSLKLDKELHDQTIWVIGADQQQKKTIREIYSNANLFNHDDDPHLLFTDEARKGLTHFVWVAPSGKLKKHLDFDALASTQKEQVNNCFKWLKYLLTEEYSSASLCLTLLTNHAYKVTGSEYLFAENAPLVGMLGSLSNEYANLNVRIFDIAPSVKLPVDVIGNTQLAFDGIRLFRNGQWLERRFVPVKWPKHHLSSELSLLSESPELCVKEGVYVIVGGAGGIGQALSEYMIHQHQAKVIWLGRREADKDIHTAIDRILSSPLITQSGHLEYRQVDATDLNQLQQVYRYIKDKFIRVNGVINAAMVFKTCSFKDMSFSDFESVYDAKAQTSINLANLLRHEDIDYWINFSSINSFITAANQCHYAAGSVFQDALSVQLQQVCSFPVKSVNWGYWTANGALAQSDIFQKWRTESGIGELTIHDAIKVLERILHSPLPQIAFINAQTSTANLPNTDTGQRLSIDMHNIKSYLNTSTMNRFLATPAQGLAGGLKFTASDDLVIAYMWLQLNRSGLFESDTFTLETLEHKFSQLCDLEHNTKLAYLQRWLTKSIRILCEQGMIVLSSLTDQADHLREYSKDQEFQITEKGKELAFDESVVGRWEDAKKAWLQNPATASQANLVSTTLETLPDILNGRKLATEVMFPGSSMDLLEGIYKYNPVSDYFNGLVAELVAHTVDNIYQANQKARILEIGAGTGGTSAVVFERLKSVQHQVEEYCYTDISRAFLVHAKEHYQKDNPFLTTKMFNVERPVNEQKVDTGIYDIIVATNVLHATRNIHRTLRNAKALLKPGGVMLLNEVSEDSTFCHMTFGLLEGWWLHEDSFLRIPECPGLTSSGWKCALEKEGYWDVAFPQLGSHVFGQQIIVAKSNGLVLESVNSHIQTQEVQHSPEESKTANTQLVNTQQESIVVASNIESKPALEREASLDVHKLKDTIKEVVANSLKYDIDEVELDEPFADYGVDSITSVNIVQSLNDTLELDLYSTCLFDYTNITRLAKYIAENFSGSSTSGYDYEVSSTYQSSHQEDVLNVSALGVSAPASSYERSLGVVAQQDQDASHSQGHTDIAVIGMSGRFGKARDLTSLWTALVQSQDLVEPVTRWNLKEYYPDLDPSEYCDAGALLERIDEFDPGFFNLSPKEATYMDPQQRVFLEECWKALEDAGVTDRSLDGADVSIYVGCEHGDYERLFDGTPPPQSFWGNAPSIIPARISYHLNLKGPALVIDTACSSSLVAIHSACESLRNGDVAVSLAGGVFVQSTPDFYLKSNRASMLSNSGKCHTFDERADGFVPGEGAGVVILKRLPDAIADNDRIYGVIKASGINQDGASNGITAPSSISQESLIKRTYAKYNINPEGIQFIEAHGTGTSLGDPIEFEALSRAFKHYTDKKGFSAIGSIKSNLGHAATAAGMAGIFKILLSLQHKKIPATLNFVNGNSKIQFEGSPFYVNTRLSDWHTVNNEPRMAAISSFGFSGTNAHIVISEPPMLPSMQKSNEGLEQQAAHLICLSAKTPEQLSRRAESLHEYIQAEPSLRCVDLSYTLLNRRSHFDYRLSMVVSSINDIQEHLSQWLKEGKSIQVQDNLHPATQKKVSSGYFQFASDTLERALNTGGRQAYKEALTMSAELYVGGYLPDLSRLFNAANALLVSLPEYPLDRKSIWVDGQNSQNKTLYSKVGLSPSNSLLGIKQTGAEILHPLLHRNVSVLGEQRFISDYSGDEYFLSEHVIHGKRILPGVSYLEMVCAALMQSLPTLMDERGLFGKWSLKFNNVGWLRPWNYESEANSLAIELNRLGNEVEFRVSGVNTDNDTVCSGEVSWSEKSLHHIVSEFPISDEIETALSSEQFYRYFEQCGIAYGERFKRVSHLDISGNYGVAKIVANTDVGHFSPDISLEPGIFDGALQSAAVLIANVYSIDQVLVPIAVEQVIVHRPLNCNVVARTQLLGSGRNDSGVYKVDIDITDESGNVVAQLIGLSFRQMVMYALNGFKTSFNVHKQVKSKALEKSENMTLAFNSALMLTDLAVLQSGNDESAFDSNRIVVCLFKQRAIVIAGADFEPVRLQLEHLAQQYTDNCSHHLSSQFSDDLLGSNNLLLQAEYLLATIQLLMTLKSSNSVQLQLVIVGEQEYKQEAIVPSISAALLAMLKTLELEEPGFHCQFLELPETTSDFLLNGDKNSYWQSGIHTLIDSAFTLMEEKYLLYKDNHFYREQRQEVFADSNTNSFSSENYVWRENGVYVISGGTGGIGFAIAKDIAKHVHSARIMLLGSRSLNAEIDAKIAEVNTDKIKVTYHTVDVSQFEQVRHFIDTVVGEESRYNLPSIHAVLHCAGMTSDSLLAYKQGKQLNTLFEPKVNGAIHLDRATQHLNIEHFVLFSSVSAVLGNVGQGDYAVANRFLDLFASYRNSLVQLGARTGKSLSINWPLWKTSGMAIDKPTLDRMYKEWGMATLEPEEGIDVLRKAMSLNYDNLFVMHGDSERIRKLFTLAYMGRQGKDVTSSFEQSASKHMLNKEHIVSLVSDILGVQSCDVDPQLHFDDYGLDWTQRNHLIDILSAEGLTDIQEDVLYSSNTIDELYELVQTRLEPFSRETSLTTAQNVAMSVSKELNHAVGAVIEQRLPTQTQGAVTEELNKDVILLLKALVHEHTQISLDDINPSLHFERYGIDSLMIVDMTNTLEAICGRLPKTLFFEYNNLTDLCAYLTKQHGESLSKYFADNHPEMVSQPESEQTSLSRENPAFNWSSPENGDLSASIGADFQASERNTSDLSLSNTATSNSIDSDTKYTTTKESVAIIGLAGRYPQANSLEVFWNNLVNGVDCISEIPEERWDHSRYFDERKGILGKTYSKWGGFIDGIEQFDPLFFNISPHDAEFMDPQERLFLQCAYHALEDAGYADIDAVQPGAVKLGECVGVYVGVMYEEYQLYGAQESVAGTPLSLGGSAASIANRVSFSFNFNGPSMAVDSMCSASLTSINLACESLLNGHCDAAVAGGVNLNLHPNKYLNLAQGNFASPDGRCKSFGADGNGYVPGEGCGAVILKTLSAALEDRDQIYGLIKATSINHAGKTNGYTVPSPNAQAQVIKQAFMRADIDVSTIGYVEAHGTGTSLGDPIEVTGLSKAFSELTDKPFHCRLGSVKSNIGHCESAAGIAGITKVLLQMKNRKLVPSLHSATLNPNIDFTDTPLSVQKTLEDWQPVVHFGERLPYRAGISSFGAGGSNAHVLIEESPLALRPDEMLKLNRPVPLMLSAASSEQLLAIVKAYLTWFDEMRFNNTSLVDIAYTLQVGRKALPERLVIVAESIQDFINKLNLYVSRASLSVGVSIREVGIFSSNIKMHRSENEGQEKQPMHHITGFDDYPWLLEWCVGRVVSDVGYWFEQFKCSRVSLPLYPFKQDSYWYTSIKGVKGDDVAPMSVNTPSHLHPLVHQNLSGFSGMKFESQFSGEEAFFKDHIVNAHKLLPGVAYLEMALQAITYACNESVEFIYKLSVEKVIWRKAIVAKPNGCTVSISLSAIDPQNYIHVNISEKGQEHDPAMTAEVRVGEPASNRDYDERVFNIDMELQKLRSESGYQKRIEAQEIYSAFANHGIVYGVSHQLIREIFVGNNRLLARIVLPADRAHELDSFMLHPAIMDSSLQTIKGFYLQEGDSRLMVPFSCENSRVYAKPGRELLVDCRRNVNGAGHQFSIDIWNSNGTLSAQLRKFTVMPFKVADSKSSDQVPSDSGTMTSLVRYNRKDGAVQSSDNGWDQYLIPRWNVIETNKLMQAVGSEKTLIVTFEHESNPGLSNQNNLRMVISLAEGYTVEGIADLIRNAGHFDKIMCIVDNVTEHEFGKLLNKQKHLSQQSFNFVKALLSLGYENRPLQITLVTESALSVLNGEEADPASASLHGFFGCLAKEYKNWHVQAIDMEQGAELSVVNSENTPVVENGTSIACRYGQWFKQILYPYSPKIMQDEPYRHGGVYVVIGGAGGLGQTWSEMMIQRYQAHIIWIGRREADAKINSSIERLSQMGPRPWYISANATNLQQMQDVLTTIKSRHSIINGVVHSAIVLKDRSLTRMTNEEFESSLLTKVDASVCLAEVFKSEPLDFALFFSSLISFTRNPGQANYATGSLFKDVFATQLARQWSCKVRVINWGYWGDVGVVSGESYRQSMEKAGILSIQSDSAMLAVRHLLNSDDRQLGFIRINSKADIQGVDADFLIECADQQYNVLSAIKADYDLINQAGSQERQVLDRLCRLDKKYSDEMEAKVLPLLCIQLRESGIFRASDVAAISLGTLLGRLKQINTTGKNRDIYESWFKYCIELIQEAGLVAMNDSSEFVIHSALALDPAIVWRQWQEYREANSHNNYVAAKSRLLDAMLSALPQILTGKIKGTDVVFPGASMELVEGVYKNNEVSDYFNRDVTLAVCSAMRAWQNKSPGIKLRILEIGAGTGGTTAGLLKALQPYADSIEEYCYTDVSRAFLNHAETHYAPDNRFLTTQLLNVEKSPLEQGFELGRYDIIIAAQVLHATESISRTLANTKLLLKQNGLLILNELSDRSVYSHLTFGMLEGWWLYQDASVRMPSSPGLFSEGWLHCLRAQGYADVYFPIQESHVMGQQIIVATSDGYNPVLDTVKSELRGNDVAEQESLVSEPLPAVVAEHTHAMQHSESIPALNSEARREQIKAIITHALSDALKVPVDAIDPEDTFSEYGLDSITGVGLAQEISNQLDIEISTTVLFDHVSVEQLAEYISGLEPELPLAVEPKALAIEMPVNTSDNEPETMPQSSGSSSEELNAGNEREDLSEYVQTTVVNALSEALKVPVEAIDPVETFSEYGLDSITGVGLAREISSQLQIELNTTALFDHVSVEQLSEFILELSPSMPTSKSLNQVVSASLTVPEVDNIASTQLQSDEAIFSKPVAHDVPGDEVVVNHYLSAPDVDPTDNSIAVVGISGRFPGAEDVNELWDKIANGVDLITPITRWDMSQYKGLSEGFCAEGGFLRDIEQFDPEFFNISGIEATYMDPQQRLFLEESWKALEDAGYAGDKSFGNKAGVYVGCNSGDYKKLISDDAPAQAFWGNAGSITPARISYYLNLKGPAIAVDTACSSSLVAIHLACQGLWSRELNLAIAGGVFVQSTPEFYLSADKAGMLSPKGRCQTFDTSADGFVPSEGVGVIVLKRLSDALADGDHIHGVIKASGMNQDGASNGITAPSAKSQQMLIESVYKRFSIAPEMIQFVEAHGTGTSLGDPIESEGLNASYKGARLALPGAMSQKTCALGSVKSNLGHSITAAGVTSVIKVLMALKHKSIPPSIHFNALNPKIDLDGSPFYVNTDLTDWTKPDNAHRMAAVSSFGFSGTNGHIVIEEAPSVKSVPNEHPMYLFVLSARSDMQVRTMARNLLTHCENNELDLPGASFTLLNGRKHCEYRLAIVAGSKNELASRLKAYLQEEKEEGVVSGIFDKRTFVKKKSLQNYAHECIDRYLLEKSNENSFELLTIIAELYVEGYSIEFKDLFSSQEHRRVSLPTYPFQKHRYWVPKDESVTSEHFDKQNISQQETEEVPMQWLLSKTLYQPNSFESISNWNELVEAWEKKLFYLVGDETQTSELKLLISQLSVKASLHNPPVVKCMTCEQVSADLKLAQLPDYILCVDTFSKESRQQLAGPEALFQIIRNTMQEDWNALVDTYYIYDGSDAESGMYVDAMSGLFESVVQENENYTFSLIQYDKQNQTQSLLQLLLLEVLQGHGFNSPVEKVKYENNERFVERYVEYEGESESNVAQGNLSVDSEVIRFQPGKNYLITGGLGPVGKLLCEYLVTHFAANFIILSRSPKDFDKQEICARFSKNKGDLYYYSTDICDREALSKTLKTVREELGVINGVIHMARMVHDNLLVAKSWDEFNSTIAAKVWGTVNLDECLMQDPVEFFALFSSIAAFGLKGGTDYGYSAAFQNSYAKYRNQLSERGLRSGVAVSQCWAGWTVDRYMPDSRMDIIKENGMQPITINEAMKMFMKTLNMREPIVGLIGVTDSVKARQFFRIEPSINFPDVADLNNLSSEKLDDMLSDFLVRRDKMTSHERQRLADSVVKLLSKFDVDSLGDSLVQKAYSLIFSNEFQPESNDKNEPAAEQKSDTHIDVKDCADNGEDIRSIVFETVKQSLLVENLLPDERLQNYGMDSVSAMQISSRLSKKLAVPIEPVWLLENPTVDSLTDYLLSHVDGLTSKVDMAVI